MIRTLIVNGRKMYADADLRFVASSKGEIAIKIFAAECTKKPRRKP